MSRTFWAPALVVVAVPTMIGLLHATPGREAAQKSAGNAPAFEYDVVSIKLNKSGEGASHMGPTIDGFNATNETLMAIIRQAYGMPLAGEDGRFSGGPSWINAEKYDVDARMDSNVADALQKLSSDDRTLAQQRMLQAFLAGRCKLTIHRETKDLPVYELVIAKNGSKIEEAKPDSVYKDYMQVAVSSHGATIEGHAATIGHLARVLPRLLGRPVLDKTGLTGKYDFMLKWTPDETQLQSGPGGGANGQPPAPAPDPNGPTLLMALQDQLGLKLESAKGPFEVIVIDHVERPSGN
jgi:uncharacterized protein (TIGR03435 family)